MNDRKKKKQPDSRGSKGPGAPPSRPQGADSPPASRSGQPPASSKNAAAEARTKAFARLGSGRFVLAREDATADPIGIYQVQDAGRVLLATSDLADPRPGGPSPVGAGVEIFVESDEPLGSPVQTSWLLSLLVRLRQLAVQTPGLRAQLDELGMLSVGVDGAPFPPAMRGVDGSVGVLLGVPAAKYPPSYMVGNHKVLLVAATVLKPDELELLLESDDEGYEELASALTESGVGHRSQLWRDSMVEEVDEEDEESAPGEDRDEADEADEDDEVGEADEDDEADEGSEAAKDEGLAEAPSEDDDLGDAGPLIMPGEEGALAHFPATPLQLRLFRELRREDPQRNLMERFVHFRFVDEQLTEKSFAFVPGMLRQGWAILSVPGENGAPDLTYTVGLHYRYGQPELVVASRGWPVEQVRRALSRAALSVALGPLAAFEKEAGGPEAVPLRFSEVSAEQRSTYLPATLALFYADFADRPAPPLSLAVVSPPA